MQRALTPRTHGLVAMARAHAMLRGPTVLGEVYQSEERWGNATGSTPGRTGVRPGSGPAAGQWLWDHWSGFIGIPPGLVRGRLRATVKPACAAREAVLESAGQRVV